MNEENIITNIVEIIERRKDNAYVKINEELIHMYWEIGKYIYELQQILDYGSKITTTISGQLKKNHPNIKGFTKRNLERMVLFYKTYKDDEVATALLSQVSWTNNLIILSGTKTKEERLFYLQLSSKK